MNYAPILLMASRRRNRRHGGGSGRLPKDILFGYILVQLMFILIFIFVAGSVIYQAVTKRQEVVTVTAVDNEEVYYSTAGKTRNHHWEHSVEIKFINADGEEIECHLHHNCKEEGCQKYAWITPGISAVAEESGHNSLFYVSNLIPSE